jgi:type VI secretion system secreted protein Hcp
MKARTDKANVTVGVLLLLGFLGLSLLLFAANSGSRVALFATAASAQPGVGISPSQVPIDPAYVKFDGIDGESQDDGHKDWINLLSFSQGQYIPPSSVGAGTAAARAVFEEIILTKELDKASPKLAEAVCKGTHFRKVEIHLARPLSGGPTSTYYTCELENAVITSYHIDASTEDPVPTEQLSLNFEKIKVTYIKTDPDGRSEERVEYGWDVRQNQPQ